MIRMRRASLSLLLLLGLASTAAAQRQRLSMDPGWRFMLGNPAGAERPAFDDHGWRRVDVPHDWSIEGAIDKDAPAGGRGGYFPTGIGWYRKTFRMPAGTKSQTASLEFDGIYMNADVWLNGFHLGHRPYGYTSVAYDISGHLVPGTNVVAVRADNSKQPNSRWYTGSGIYRHTWLVITAPTRVAHWGVSITTPKVDSTAADVVVRTTIENRTVGASRATLRSIVLDQDGREVARQEVPFSVKPDGDTLVEQRIHLDRPRLWSVETPTLYALRTELVAGARTMDTLRTAFGVRSIAFDADRGFLLNGTRVKLKGVNLHHEAGAVGAAVPERIWELRLRALKSMGANAIRTSHNPPAPEFLDLCDRLGFLVMAEAFDEWTVGKVDEGYHRYFEEWSERDVTDFVHRDRNHPSIVLWSAGNEIGDQTTPNGPAVLHHLVEIFHREDPTRLVTTGNDNIAADGHPTPAAFLENEDVVGYNYVDRWHERREIMAEQDRHDHPNWKMIGTESGTMFQSRDERYSLGDDSSVVNASYAGGMMAAERLWKWVATRDYFSGNFIWTGVDYLGESTWPFKGFSSGTLDITNYPHDSYYLYQSQWSTTPTIHLVPHWNWPGREGQVIPVLVYTNCNRVELFLNGKSLGEKRLEFPAQGTSGGWNSYALPVVNATTNDLHLSWDVPYQPGVLKAVGRERDGTVACNAEVKTAGRPTAVRLEAVTNSVTASGNDVALVRFTVVDSAGTVVPTAENVVRFTVTGGSIVGLDNGNLQDHDLYRSNNRRAFNGRGLAILRASAPGHLTITASADGLTGATATVTALTAPLAVVPAAR